LALIFQITDSSFCSPKTAAPWSLACITHGTKRITIWRSVRFQCSFFQKSLKISRYIHYTPEKLLIILNLGIHVLFLSFLNKSSQNIWLYWGILQIVKNIGHMWPSRLQPICIIF
jgi:hypothetical protein